MQARMDELVANMDAYEAGTDRALAESGLKAAEEAYLAKSDEVLAAVYEMMEFEPETLDGCGAQMCALALWCGYAEDFSDSEDFLDNGEDQHIARTLVVRLASRLSAKAGAVNV